jgi:DNA polymerase-3 subunit beta
MPDNATDLLSSIMAQDFEEQPEPEAAQTVKFEIKKFVLQALLEKAITVVPTRDVMPVLKCFQFVVDPQRLRVIASDCELSLIASTPMVAVSYPGTAVFPAKKLLEIVKSAQDGDVSISVKGTSAHVVIGRASWTLQLQGGYDYPAMPAISEAEFTAVDKATFQNAISAVRYAASRDPSRANLNIIDIRDGKLTACDGSRIQQIQISDFPISLIIPIAAVDDLLRLLKISDLETIHVGQSEDQLIFRFGSDVFIVSKFRAAFPDMEAQMLRPALENRHQLHADRSELLSAIKRVRINADIESSAIALHIEATQVTVSAKDKYGNTASESLSAAWTGPARTVVVNHRFLTDMINTYGDATCGFRLGEDSRTRRSPLLLRHSTTGSTGLVQQMQADWVGQ